MSKIKINDQLTIKFKNNTYYNLNKIIQKYVERRHTTVEDICNTIKYQEKKTQEEVVKILVERAVKDYETLIHSACYTTQILLAFSTLAFATLAYFSISKLFFYSQAGNLDMQLILAALIFCGIVVAIVLGNGLNCFKFKEKSL